MCAVAFDNWPHVRPVDLLVHPSFRSLATASRYPPRLLVARWRKEWGSEMRLAEALALRADTARRVEQLRARIVSSARYQEGEEPAEDAAALLSEVAELIDELESLIRRINRTNAATPLGEGTITDALARRDALRLRHSVLTSAADAAAGTGHPGMVRQLRSELPFVAALPVAELRRQIDHASQRIRELDMRIQRANWEAELLD